MPAPRSSRWRVESQTNHTSLAAVQRLSLIQFSPASREQSDYRHNQTSVTLSLEAVAERAVGMLRWYKTDQDITPTSATALETSDTAFFHNVPFSATGTLPLRYHMRWKQVKVNDKTTWGVLLDLTGITATSTLQIAASYTGMLQTKMF